MSITIQTRLADGIYRSDGGGETRTHYTWTTGPRNLVKAIRKLSEHRAEMSRCYGNIGCGRSWLEIDGVAMDAIMLSDVPVHDATMMSPSERRLTWAKLECPTDKARHVLANIDGYSQAATT